MCLAKIWPLVFLESPHHLLDRFWGPQDGDLGFSSGGYQGRGGLSVFVRYEGMILEVKVRMIPSIFRDLLYP